MKGICPGLSPAALRTPHMTKSTLFLMYVVLAACELCCVQDEAASFELLNVLKKQPMTLQVLQVISHFLIC